MLLSRELVKEILEKVREKDFLTENIKLVEKQNKLDNFSYEPSEIIEALFESSNETIGFKERFDDENNSVFPQIEKYLKK